jgi:cytochrome b subunit of formate dehydrogenase
VACKVACAGSTPSESELATAVATAWLLVAFGGFELGFGGFRWLSVALIFDAKA